jgi:hydroxypyruvate isomerase
MRRSVMDLNILEAEGETGMDRRTFLAAGIAAGTAAMINSKAEENSGGEKKFKLKYAPTPGMFKNHAGKDPISQIKFIADNGFTAFFDNGLMNMPTERQEKLAKEAEQLGMTIGPFVAYADFKQKSFVTNDKDIRQMLIAKMKEAVETGKRTNCKWTLVVPGPCDERIDADYQTQNVIENLKYCTEVCEQSGLIIVIEPLNPKDHPGLFLKKIPQAYKICKGVNSPCCKILDDIYHQQITEGNLIPNIDTAWEQIAGFHIGDNPGRNEPTTGEINYRNIFKHLHEKGYKGVLCMEHGSSKEGKEGEKAVIEAYRWCDNF